MITTWMLRVDIDDIDGLRKGVPILLDLSRTYDIPMTFFLPLGGFQTGKNILRLQTGKNIFHLLNPKVFLRYNPIQLFKSLFNKEDNYIDEFRALHQQIRAHNCELSLHGYQHAYWIANWAKLSNQQQITLAMKGLVEFQNIFHSFPLGFAAPGFKTSQHLEEKMLQLPLLYISNDYLISKKPEIVGNKVKLPINIPLIEELRIMNYSTTKILDIYRRFKEHQIAASNYIAFYVHPINEPIKEYKLLKAIIEDFSTDDRLQSYTMANYCRYLKKL